MKGEVFKELSANLEAIKEEDNFISAVLSVINDWHHYIYLHVYMYI